MRIVLCSVPPDHADRIATALVERRLAACVSVVPAVASTYRWRGTVERATEALLIVKTAADRVAELLEALPLLHPYELPEIVTLEVREGESLPAYLAWIVSETRPLSGSPGSSER
jgi:periplasmic divalent cation tolerance protein